MSNIPKKGEQGNTQGQQEAQRQQKIKSDVTTYTDKIVAAMGQNKNSISEQLFFPEPEAQAQIIADFKNQGWTVTFKPMRSGGIISWS
ncbi:MAG: hypothetical protein JSS83_08605 [Cyanobacteria bacterium SZAS LIN-3]|nr:hypothetical protein [Cyanobacteria bacterium SZAS LIN-3]MBS2008298.1 hypothetical protein [Cyanobacteria bacterium SZAS TMP-1]